MRLYEVNPALQNAVLEILSVRKAHVRTGNLDGEESLSSLLDELRWKGWKNFGNLSDFETLMKDNGFTIRVTYVGRGTRRAYVGV